MTNDELIECAEAVLNFLIHGDDEFRIIKTIHTPSLNNMTDVLEKHCTTMVNFTLILNNKLHLLNNPLWIDSPQEFFSDHQKSEKFFETSIKLLTRKSKIHKLKQNGRIINFY